MPVRVIFRSFAKSCNLVIHYKLYSNQDAGSPFLILFIADFLNITIADCILLRSTFKSTFATNVVVMVVGYINEFNFNCFDLDTLKQEYFTWQSGG